MVITFTFYKTSSDYRQLNKVLGTALGTAQGYLHERINDISMVIRLPGEYLNYCQNANIVYSSVTEKYYFLESYDVENNMVLMHLKEDVRMNFATQIKGITCTIVRNEGKSNAYLVDSEYNVLAYDNIVTIGFNFSFTDESLVLLTVG